MVAEINKPIIRLWLNKGIGLIICHSSGVNYTNQVGGSACLHPKIEGVFIPLFDEVFGEEQEKKLNQYFTGTKWKGCCWNGIDEETANFVDEVLSTSLYTKRLKVNREKFVDSYEAWIYVNLSSEEEDSEEFYGFPNNFGILTWNNSD